jgi:AraC-like DNA-binding protein
VKSQRNENKILVLSAGCQLAGDFIAEFGKALSADLIFKLRDAGDFSQVVLILVCCDFRCRLGTCRAAFQLMRRFPAIPFALVRRFYLNSSVFHQPVYWLSRLDEACSSRNRPCQLDELGSCQEFGEALMMKFNSGSTIYKVLRAQKEMLEKPRELHDLKVVSKIVGLSSFCLSRKFRKMTGVSFSDFKNEIRLCTALGDLINTDQPVKEVAFNAGYKHASFCRRFKICFGVPPSCVRRDHEFLPSPEERLSRQLDGAKRPGNEIKKPTRASKSTAERSRGGIRASSAADMHARKTR